MIDLPAIDLPFIDLPEIRLPSVSFWIELLGGFYGAWGYPLVLLAATLENTFVLTFVVPGGTMVLLGGVYARLGQLELPLVVLVGWAGTFAGASIDYAIGRWGERTVLHRLLRAPEVAVPLEKAGELLRRYGPLALLGGHFVPQVRSLVAVAAGLTGLRYRRFALYEAPVALVWSSVYALGGYFLADHIPLFEQAMQRFGWAVLIVVGLFFALKVYRGRPAAPER